MEVQMQYIFCLYVSYNDMISANFKKMKRVLSSIIMQHVILNKFQVQTASLATAVTVTNPYYRQAQLNKELHLRSPLLSISSASIQSRPTPDAFNKHSGVPVVTLF
uniref:Uncharacterized protein n=1 Tax=Sphaerodactylus townsendi TaxID=933632 RepID=A0ACB8FUX7_9SAUR